MHVLTSILNKEFMYPFMAAWFYNHYDLGDRGMLPYDLWKDDNIVSIRNSPTSFRGLWTFTDGSILEKTNVGWTFRPS